MVVEARDNTSGETHYFEVNFPPKNGAEYQFMWLDGRRRILEVRQVPEAPPGAVVRLATFDVPSHEIIVQEGR
jgi:hypothetical protein